MGRALRSVITGTGSYIPTEVKTNMDFHQSKFFGEDEERITSPPEQVAKKLQQITGIKERRYITDDLTSSDIGTTAAQKALDDSGTDPETIDQLIVAHNFGDMKKGVIQMDVLPSIASRIKNKLKIKNPQCVTYDLLFGCPGWIQGVIQANAFIHAGMSKKCLVVGTETLSRVIDPFDRDSMIFSDGAGACVIEGLETDGQGVLGTSALSHCEDETYFLHLGKSFSPGSDPNIRYMKMKGRKVYEYAITHVPQAMKDCLDKSGIPIEDLKKVFIHQANEKLDEGIIKRFFQLYDIKTLPENIMPMSIHELGNSSVATVPTLYDMVKKGKIEDHELNNGDVVLFASVGAGMNINAICYRV